MLMPQREPAPDFRQIEQIIETIFTCRTVFKYDLQLGDTQRDTLLKDIDAALDTLRLYLTLPSTLGSDKDDTAVDKSISSTLFNKISLVPFASDALSRSGDSAGSLPVPEAPDTQAIGGKKRSDENEKAEGGEDEVASVLRDLYHLYHASVDAPQGPTITTFVLRFNTAMTMIDELQRHYGASGDSEALLPADDASVESIEQLRSLIADLYSMYMSFIDALSKTLQQNDVQLDTEEMKAVAVKTRTSQFVRSISDDLSLFYGRYRSLAQRKEPVLKKIAASMAFLEFLKEHVWVPLHRVHEVQTQGDNVIALLREVTLLLDEYEQTMTLFLFPHRNGSDT